MLCFSCNLLCIRIFATVERKHGELLVSAVFLYGLRFMILCESATGIYTILRRRVDPSQLHSHSGCIYYILPIREPSVHALLPAHRLTDNRPAALGHWKSFHYIINVCVWAAVNASDKKKLPSQREYVHDRIVTWATRHQTTNDTSKRKKSVKIKWI